MTQDPDFLLRVLAISLLRYVLVAGVAYAVFYVIYKKYWQPLKLQARFPHATDYWREIGYSLLTVAIFTSVAIAIFTTPLRGNTLAYDTIHDFGWPYWVVSILLMVLLHDTYFYWFHRLMHHPWIYRRVHRVHHQSTNPSPWVAYAFHPLEAVIEAGVIFPIVFFIPYHRSALFIFLFFMIVYNVYGHLGYELYPKGFNKTRVGHWLNTSVNHNQHHEKFTGNYGLYFLFWDRWMGTIRADYDEAFIQSDKKRAGPHLANEPPPTLNDSQRLVASDERN